MAVLGGHVLLPAQGHRLDAGAAVVHHGSQGRMVSWVMPSLASTSKWKVRRIGLPGKSPAMSTEASAPPSLACMVCTVVRDDRDTRPPGADGFNTVVLGAFVLDGCVAGELGEVGVRVGLGSSK